MNTEELIKKYNNGVKEKFLALDISSNANSKNTKVIDCFYNKRYKDDSLKETCDSNMIVDNEQTKQLEDSICNEILKIKDTDIEILLLRIHSPYDSANKIYGNMDIIKIYIEENMNHQIKVFLFDDIDSGFFKFI